MGRLLAFGITMTIGMQAAMNVAVVTVSVPTKGIALPLVSAGGSGAIVMGGLVGILANIPRLAAAGSGEPALAASGKAGT
jgi:cell division protein FtsW